MMHGVVWQVERSKRYEEGIVHILSPHPPEGARGIRKQHSGPEGEHSDSSESVGKRMFLLNLLLQCLLFKV